MPDRRMRPISLSSLRALASALAVMAAGWVAAAGEPRHANAMHGEPALGPDFKAFAYVNPHAPKGGTLVQGGREPADARL